MDPRQEAYERLGGPLPAKSVRQERSDGLWLESPDFGHDSGSIFEVLDDREPVSYLVCLAPAGLRRWGPGVEHCRFLAVDVDRNSNIRA